MNPTRIGWTHYSWNPIVGCSKISSGCANCYAEEVSTRFGFTSLAWSKKNEMTNVQLKPDRLKHPCKVIAPQFVFTCSMSDMFHEAIPDTYLDDVFHTMRTLAPQHQYQVLTKRIERAKEYCESVDLFPQNVWIGTSVENRDALHRIDTLRSIDADIPIRFLSIEPLLEHLGDVNYTKIDWCIVGGESGSKYRAMDMEWVRDIRDQTRDQSVPLFFKQSAGRYSNMQPYIVEKDSSHSVYHEMPDGYNHFL